MTDHTNTLLGNQFRTFATVVMMLLLFSGCQLQKSSVSESHMLGSLGIPSDFTPEETHWLDSDRLIF